MENQMTVAGEMFSDTFLKISEQPPTVRRPKKTAAIEIPQKTLRCIWNEQLFKSRTMTTVGGETLEIVFPGHWNFGPGPDFKNAAFKVGGQTLEGDVEIHVYRSDRKGPAAAKKPGFENVVLQVFMWQGKSKKKPASKTTVHELELKERLTKGVLELNNELDFNNYPVLNQYNFGLCHQPLARLSSEKLTHLLNVAGDARIFTKMNRFNDRVIDRGYEQTLYEGVAEALGYPANKKPFRTLAETLPLTSLQALLAKKMKPADRVLHIQALLFGMAGLIDFKVSGKGELPAENKKYIKKIQAIWGQYASELPPIAALGHLIVRHQKNNAPSGLFADLIAEIQLAMSQPGNRGYSKKTANKLCDFFYIEEPDFWADHYSPAGKKLSAPQALIGPARSSEITVNIVIPIGLIYARASKSVAMEATLNWLLKSGKRTSDNRLMRFMKHYIFGNNEKMLKVLASDKETQGLMQVYQDFCTQNENNCLSCRFPDVVNRNFA
jgi:hypothetical protein